MTGRVLLLSALIALLAVLLEWRLLDRERAPASAPPERPGYYLAGVDLEEYGTSGKLRIRLKSERAVEDPASGVVTLSAVAVDYHAPTGRQWLLTADAGRVPPGSRAIEFEGGVRLKGGLEGVAATELRTARLTLDTVTERAQTREPVELVFGRHSMQARGMRADLKAGSLHLESSVNGLFTP